MVKLAGKRRCLENIQGYPLTIRGHCRAIAGEPLLVQNDQRVGFNVQCGNVAEVGTIPLAGIEPDANQQCVPIAPTEEAGQINTAADLFLAAGGGIDEKKLVICGHVCSKTAVRRGQRQILIGQSAQCPIEID